MMTAAAPTSIAYRPIGVVHSPFTEPAGTPIQPSRAAGITGTVEVFPEFAAGLADLDGFSHIILLCHLHRSRGCRMTVVPFLDTEPRGLFATRAPCRPNPIGLSVVRLLGVAGTSLSIEGVDLLDGTPVLDIKPFVGDFDRPTDIRTGWLGTARKRRNRADDRFGDRGDGPPPPVRARDAVSSLEEERPMRTIRTETAPSPRGHYSQAVIHGDMVFVSGQLPIDPLTGEPRVGTIEEQTRLALDNLAAILEAAGSGMSRVIKTTVYVSDIKLWGRVNQVYGECFGENRPARAVVPTRDLHFGCLVEVEAIAVVRPD